MKKRSALALGAFQLLLFCACGSEDYSSDFPIDIFGGTAGSASGTVSVAGDLDDINVAIDTTPLDEEETVPVDGSDPLYDDYVENTEWKNIFTITYNGNSATVEGQDDDISIVAEGAHVTVNAGKKAKYILQGSSCDGSFKIYGDSKFEVNLNGLSLTNPGGAAINSQTKKRMFLTATEGTANSLADGQTYVTTEGEDMKGVIFSEGQIVLSGKGTLSLTASGKNGLATDQYLRIRKNTSLEITSGGTNGIKANDSIVIDGGVQNIVVTSTAGKGFTTDGRFIMNGGRAVVLTSGDATYEDYDTSSAAGVKADSLVVINGGELGISSSGSGGKGINCDQRIYINEGAVTVITSGGKYSYGTGGQMRMGGFGGGGTTPDMGGMGSTSNTTSSPKGIKAEGNLSVSGGTVRVRCSGGSGSEGMESKSSIDISGGDVLAYCYDDCINASGTVSFSGGRVYALSTGNDAVDSNYGRSGAISISGGVVIALCAVGGVEEGLDADNNSYISLSGGCVFSAGGSQGMGSSLSSASQAYGVFSASFGSEGYYTVADASGANIYTFKLPCSINSTFTIVSSPSMGSGTYSVSYGSAAPTDATSSYYGFYFGSTAKGDTQLTTFTATSSQVR